MLVLCQMCTLKSAEDLKQNECLSSWLSLIPFESVSEFEHYVLQTFSGNWLYFTRELPFTLRKTRNSNMQHQDFHFYSPHTSISSINESNWYLLCWLSLIFKTYNIWSGKKNYMNWGNSFFFPGNLCKDRYLN